MACCDYFGISRTQGKIEGIPVLALTKNCQRREYLIAMVKAGKLTPDTKLESCYGGTCFKECGMAAWNSNKISVDPLERASVPNISKWFTPANITKMSSFPFIREGQKGCSSWAFKAYDGAPDSLAVAFLRGLRSHGIKSKVVFITACYADVEDAEYRALAEYREHFVIHVSLSGWFPLDQLALRFAELDRMISHGLPVKMRLITNADNIESAPGKIMSTENETFVLAELRKRNIAPSDILETPYHNDNTSKHSKAKGGFSICCSTGKCSTCPTKCLTK